jgi:hypothetical protein
MLRFAGMKKPGQPMRIAWRQAKVVTPIKETDFFTKGRSLTLSIEESAELIQVLQQGLRMMVVEKAQMEQEAYERQMEEQGVNTPRELEELGLVEDRRRVIAVPDGEKTKGGIVLPPGVKVPMN